MGMCSISRPGDRIAHGRFDKTFSANGCFHDNMGTFHNLSDNRCIFSVFMRPECSKNCISIGSGNTHNHFSFIGNFKRIDTQHAGGTLHVLADGDILFRDPYTDTTLSVPSH